MNKLKLIKRMGNGRADLHSYVSECFMLSDTEWLLALRRPEPVARKKQSNTVPLARQLPLPEFGATG